MEGLPILKGFIAQIELKEFIKNICRKHDFDNEVILIIKLIKL